jgi:hypothetical protein
MFATAISYAQTADELINKHIEAIGGKENWKKVNSMRSVKHMQCALETRQLSINTLQESPFGVQLKANQLNWCLSNN